VIFFAYFSSPVSDPVSKEGTREGEREEEGGRGKERWRYKLQELEN
jgi:hypothetical protein